jgi:pSer/pThr/pTyr-binding forkhead associated (FHA) protein
MMAALHDGRGHVHELGDDTSIGRAPENDLVLPEGLLSREHATIYRRGSRWYIEDRGSRNGTSVNGDRLPFGRPRPLRDRDRLLLGTLAFTFRVSPRAKDADDTATMETATPARRIALTDYQQQVLTHLGGPWLEGGEPASNAEIAALLGTPLAVDAVKASLRRLYGKFGLSDSAVHAKRRALCSTAHDLGLI